MRSAVGSLKGRCSGMAQRSAIRLRSMSMLMVGFRMMGGAISLAFPAEARGNQGQAPSREALQQGSLRLKAKAGVPSGTRRFVLSTKCGVPNATADFVLGGACGGMN